MATPPCYMQPCDAGLVDFYGRIFAEGGLPVLIYNVLPKTPVTPAAMLELVKNPGIIGTKESIGGNLETLTVLLATIGDKISVTWADDRQLYPGFAIGATGAITAMSSVLPWHTIELWNAVQRSDIKTAQRMHMLITGVAHEIGHVNWPGGVKLAVNLQGRKVGPCRSPYVAVEEEKAARIEAALKVALSDEVAARR